ncbi:hypothetical protein IWQ57_003117, partial [Coemansia nantahalensis]
YRMESLSHEGLEKVQQQAAAALELTKARIPREVLAALPPVPDITKVPMAAFTGRNFRLDHPAAPPSPFALGRVLVVPSETGAKLQVSLPLAGLPGDLWPHLPVFVGLLKASVGLVVPSAVAGHVGQAAGLPITETPGMPVAYVESDRTDGALTKALVDYDACIGRYSCCGVGGNRPDEVLTLYASTSDGDVARAFALLAAKLLFGEFSSDAALRVAQAQKRDLSRQRGTGSSLLIDTFQWLRTPGALDIRAIMRSDGSAPTRPSRVVNEPPARALNHYFQSAYLAAAVQSLKKGNGGDGLAGFQGTPILDAIFRIRAHIASCVASAGLIHMSLPRDVGAVAARKMVHDIAGVWGHYSGAWQESLRVVPTLDSPREPPVSSKVNGDEAVMPPRKRRRTGEEKLEQPLPWPVIGPPPGGDNYVVTEAPVGVYLALEDLQTSYVGVQIPARAQWTVDPASSDPFEVQLAALPCRDAYALYLLTNILNRTGGLIKNAIRGRGYAYGVGIHPRLDHGYLAIYISHAVDAQKSLGALWETLQALEAEDEWNDAIDEFQLDAARSMMFLHTYTRVAESLVPDDAAAQFFGFAGLEQRLLWVRKHVECVTLADLRHAFLKYYAPFVAKDTASAIYLVATPQSAYGTEADCLGWLNDNPYGVRFKQIELSCLDPVVRV